MQPRRTRYDRTKATAHRNWPLEDHSRSERWNQASDFRGAQAVTPILLSSLPLRQNSKKINNNNDNTRAPFLCSTLKATYLREHVYFLFLKHAPFLTHANHAPGMDLSGSLPGRTHHALARGLSHILLPPRNPSSCVVTRVRSLDDRHVWYLISLRDSEEVF